MNVRLGKQQSGMTLVEMMVAMLIGTVLIAGALTVYLQSKANYQTTDSLARLQDNLRFALDTLEPDLRLAGFWGMHNQSGAINPGAVTVTCAGGTAAQATAIVIGAAPNPTLIPVQAVDDNYNLGCPGRVPRVNSDVLMLRHASPRTTAIGDLGPGQVYAEVSMGSGQLFDDAVAPGQGAPVEYREVVANVYYVGESTFEPAVPALRRLSLVDGGAQGLLQDQEVIPGVENLQVQFGLDTDANGEVDRYVDGNHPLAQPGAAGASILAVRLWLLVRSDSSEGGVGFVDNGVYQPADADLPPIQPTLDADYPADFRRAAISKTIFLRNGQG
ncbi:MAG: PilW family protein [Gammaproteobacteria bacterium]|nr:PilW family protein [Gammaproteobacteria bacterium]